MIMAKVDSIIYRRIKMEWISVKDRLPEKTDKYKVRKKPTLREEFPTPLIAVFIRADGVERWCININSTYWEILGVHEWMLLTPPKEDVS